MANIGGGISAPSMRLKRKLPAENASVRDVRLLAIAYAGEVCEPNEQLFADIALCVSEAATNVIQHAYPDHTPAGAIELEVYKTDSRLVIQIADTGIGVSDTIQPGTGLRLISQLATTQISHHRDTGTTLRMTFPCPQTD